MGGVVSAALPGAMMFSVVAAAAPPAPLGAPPDARSASVFCFDHSDRALVEGILDANGAMPPGWFAPLGARYSVDTFGWRGEADITVDGRALAAHLTYSFVPDGVVWGLEEVQSPGGSTAVADLNQRLVTLFGAENLDLGREYIRQAMAVWESRGGLTYTEVADDGTVMTENTVRSPLRGDIRIGGGPLSINGVLGYNAFPSPNGVVGTGGGDMFINTSYFGTTTFNNPGNDYLLFRNLVTHEHGHGLGLRHVVPCDGTKLMEPFIQSFIQGAQADDLRSVGRMNGDGFSGNNSPGRAASLGNLSTPVRRAAFVDGVSTNGAGGFGNSDEDYYRFTIDQAEDVTISATPTGGTYENGPQTLGCIEDEVGVVDAEEAGNLLVQLYDGSGVTLLATSPGVGPGGAETIDAAGLPAGAYIVKVIDVGPNPSVDQDVQLYDLEIAPDGARRAPIAVAGIDKRIEAGEKCFFISDINSRVTEPGQLLDPFATEWDLDGDGVYETFAPRPDIRYVSNGEFEVGLRVYDTAGTAGEDTITVTVFGAETGVESVSPAAGPVGATLPVTITGTNLLGVTSASQVSVSGSGVAVAGTPVVNAMGSEITGLSFTVAKGAFPGPRNVTIDSGDGVGTGVGVFAVAEAGSPDLDGDGAVGSGDLGMLLAAWGPCGGCAADLDGDGVVGSPDLGILLAAWGS